MLILTADIFQSTNWTCLLILWVLVKIIIFSGLVWLGLVLIFAVLCTALHHE